MSHKHLSLEDRYYIMISLKKGNSKNEISKFIGRSQSTISREVNRNTGKRGYRYRQANESALNRHKIKPKNVKLTCEIKELIKSKIKEDWSPEQIVAKFKLDDIISLHHESIYQYVLDDKKQGGFLYKHLRHQGKTYRKRYGSAHNRTGIPNRVGIDERPKIVDERERVGDWEADTIIGKNHKGAIVTMDERKSKLRLAAPIKNKTAQNVLKWMTKLLEPIQEYTKTITFDNGKEFTLHEKIAKKLECDTYFANPYHSWERGQNENANGLLRQYFPKKMELMDVTLKQVLKAVDKLNSRPRKCLGYKTPYEVFEKLTGIDVRKIWGYAFIT